MSESVLKIKLLASRFCRGSLGSFDKFKFQIHSEGSFENKNPTAEGGWKEPMPKALSITSEALAECQR